MHVRAGPISNRWFIIELRQTKIECLRIVEREGKIVFLRDIAQRIFLRKKYQHHHYHACRGPLEGVGEDRFGKNKGLVERGDVTPNPGG